MKSFFLRTGFVVGIFLLLVSCGKEKSSGLFGRGVISMRKMAQIVADIHLVEAGVRATYPDRIEGDTKLQLYYQEIFEKYGITKSSFERSLEYYQNHPEELNKMYEEVVNLLNRHKDEDGKKLPIKNP